jgi:nucleolin
MVNFIPQSVDEQRLRALFSECGEIASCKLIADKLTGRHKAFGFVNFLTHDAAKAAISKFNGM